MLPREVLITVMRNIRSILLSKVRRAFSSPISWL